MNKFVIIIILLLLGSYTIAQQPYLNKTFVFDNNNYIHTIIPTDSGYILGGCYRNAITLVDSTANEKWTKSYSFSPLSSWIGDGSPNAIHKTGSGNYIAGGTIQNGIATINKVYLIKYSNTFDTVLTKIILSDVTCDGCLNVINSFINTLGKYILIGADSKDSTGNYFQNKYENGLLLKLDTNGTTINHKLFGSTIDHDWLNTGLQMGNNYYLFGGTYSYASGGVVGFDRLDGWVVKTDLQGNEILSAAFGNPVLSDREFTYALMLPNNRIITGRDKGIAIHLSGFRMYQPWAIILNNDLSVFKEFYFKNTFSSGDTLFNSNFEQAIMNEDSSISFLGRNVALSITNMTIIFSNAFILNINRDYKVNYYREFKHNGGDFTSINPNVITTTADGGYIFGGYVYDNTLIPPQQSLLVKTDSLGCDGFHSCDDTTLVCQILQAPDTACKNDTAWLHVKFKGRSAPYFIYANTTLALDSIYYPYTLPLWIDTLVPYIPTTLGMQQVIIKVNDPWGWFNSDTVQIFVKNCGTGSIAETWYPKKVEIYPNPATNELHVKIRTTLTAPVTITIYNMQGKTVKQITTKQNENVIDISGLEQGVYGVRVVGDFNVVERFVKM